MRVLRLDWPQFDAAVQAVAAAVAEQPLCGVYGIPRGGLPLAVAVSHRLDLPLRSTGGPGVLILDDVCDSGATLEEARWRYPESVFWVWATREREPQGYRAVLTDIGPDWIVFPWEAPERAERDRQRYKTKR